MDFFKTIYPSPVGMLQITCSSDTLCALTFRDETGVEEASNPNHLTDETARQLDGYFGGTRQLFHIPMLQQGTPFQSKVWALLQAIPYGKTVSYRDLSKRYGDVKAIRAIASANGKNSLAIIVPCHRVIGSDQSLTGYAGGLWRKQWLLAHEAKWSRGVQELF